MRPEPPEPGSDSVVGEDAVDASFGSAAGAREAEVASGCEGACERDGGGLDEDGAA